MNILIRASLALAAGVLSMPVLAAGRAGPLAQPTRTSASQLAARVALTQQSRPAPPVEDGVPGKALQANDARTYPPSCLSDPLPENPSGPVYAENVTLEAHNTDDTTQRYSEDVTISIWRVACSSGGEFFNSATLMRIDRQAQYEGDNRYYPLLPDVRVAQVNDRNNIDFGQADSDAAANFVRVAVEPNTVISDAAIESPIVFSQTYVLENFAGNPACNGPCYDFNFPFTVRFDNFLFESAEDSQYFIDVPAYAPTQSTYPDAFSSLPITGYMSSNWYAPGFGGEGIVVQVYERTTSSPGSCENLGGGVILPFSFTWFTYDDSGLPFWIFGDGCVPAGDPSRITVDANYITGLGFAANFDPADRDVQPWGEVSFEFPTCNEMYVDYAADPGLPAGIPSGVGNLDYFRLGNVNGLTCE